MIDEIDKAPAAALGRKLLATCMVPGCAVVLSLYFGASSAYADPVQSPSEASDSSKAVAARPVDQSLTFYGITLYGVIDLGYQYETHGAPYSDYHPAGSANIVQKNSRQSVSGFTPSNVSQSRVGLQGLESIGFGDWNAVFRLETFFNPQSGQLADAEKSLVLNNGRAANAQSTNLDSSVAGEAFETIYGGFSSSKFGTITFGRNTGLLADGVAKYDPTYASQAFSLIGMSGTYAGGGDTQDRRLDSSLKYLVTLNDMFRLGAQYKFSGSNGSANTDIQAQVGADLAGLSFDAYFSRANSAISAAPLSEAQVAALPALGYSVSNSLAGTISDNTALSFMALYNLNAFKFFAGYEHLRYANPTRALPAGFDSIGGYVLAFVDNAAFPKDKMVNLAWTGVRYTAIKNLDLVGAAYYYRQNSYGTGATAGCSTSVAATCSGYFEAYSINADYWFTPRFMTYLGAMYSAVYNGVASGYIQRNNINPTIGLRFTF
jgi:predicted porin